MRFGLQLRLLHDDVTVSSSIGGRLLDGTTCRQRSKLADRPLNGQSVIWISRQTA